MALAGLGRLTICRTIKALATRGPAARARAERQAASKQFVRREPALGPGEAGAEALALMRFLAGQEREELVA